MKSSIKQVCLICISFFLIPNIYGQRDYSVAILPFKGINMEDVQIEQATMHFNKKLSQYEHFQMIDLEDIKPILKAGGFEDIHTLDGSGLFAAGDFLGLDLIITGFVSKGYEDYSFEVKVFEISDVFIGFHKTINVKTEEELTTQISQVSNEIIHESTLW